MLKGLYGVAGLAILLTGGDDADRPDAAGKMALVINAQFEDADLSAWEFTDPNAWRVSHEKEKGSNRVLDQFRQSQYQPKVRSPLNIALAKGIELGDFVLDLRVRSTTRDYPHRDLCLFFGRQDPSHFYYVHFGKEADANANSIFLVDGKPRVSIAAKRTKGTPWTDGWHHVRVVREVKSGRIDVYFDDMKNPAMTASDKTFAHGQIGVGSFDDTGMFDDIRVWGEKTTAEPRP